MSCGRRPQKLIMKKLSLPLAAVATLGLLAAAGAQAATPAELN